MNTEYPFIFTRYLYSKEDVIHSLFISLLEKKIDEALFWAFELYYSGFQEETIELLFSYYTEIYEKQNTRKFKDFMIKHCDLWKETKQDCIVGTMVWNLCYSKYDLSQFIQHYFKKTIDCNINKNTNTEKKIKLRLIMNDKNIESYKTIEHQKGLGWKILPYVCKYKIHREVSSLFENDNIDFKDKYYYHWLYYASFSPIWKDRLKQYNYRICNDTKKICMNDDDEDDFYSLYSYIPDEQTLETQEKCLGGDVIQLTLDEFCKKYCCLSN